MRMFQELVMDTRQRPFMVGAELVTTRGSLNQPTGAKLTKLADGLASCERIDWVSITDNAGGNPMESPSVLARRIRQHGTDTIVHLTCKDRNRNALEATAWQLHSDELHNVLSLTGDYPAAGQGYMGTAAPVFDLDSTTLCRMLHDMNDGLRIPGRKPGSFIDLDPTQFVIGCAVSPFKTNEAELMCQYLKLAMKVNNGAQFVIPQLGYDMRKSHELLIFQQQHGMAKIPVFGNIFMLTKTVARLFNRRQIPGCQVSDALLAKVEEAAKGPDKGKAFFRELAAKQYACFRGMGYRGAYFGGFTKVSAILEVIELAESYSDDDWKSFSRDVIWPMEQDFYLYKQHPSTGLADASAPSPELAQSSHNHTVDEEQISSFYKLSSFIHDQVFNPQGLLYKPLKRAYTWLDNGEHPGLYAVAERGEKGIKKVLYDCQDCGDCSLADCYFLCPGAACRKNQRNGPCGGSRGPLCESADVPCIWYRAYNRAKAEDQLDNFLKREPILRDQALRGTSGWANYFLGRDHVAKPLVPDHDPDNTDEAPEKPDKPQADGSE